MGGGGYLWEDPYVLSASIKGTSPPGTIRKRLGCDGQAEMNIDTEVDMLWHEQFHLYLLYFEPNRKHIIISLELLSITPQFTLRSSSVQHRFGHW